MTSLEEPGLAERTSVRSAATALLAIALTASSVNLAVSLLDRPRAFEQGAKLADPLAVGFVLFFLGVSVALALRKASGRLVPRAWAVAVGAAATTIAVLGPISAVLRRDVSAPREPALWALLVAVVIAVSSAAYLAAARCEDRVCSDRTSRVLTLGAPVVAFEFLLVVWWSEYRLGHEIGAVRVAVWAGLVAVSLVTLQASVRVARPLPLLFALTGLTLASPLAGLADTHSTGATSRVSPDPDGPACVLLITVDTLRPDWIEAPTDAPGIQALLDDSIVFSNARSAAPWTKPAMATILTGVSPLVHGTLARRSRLPAELETLAESMQSAGYRTAGLGLNVHLERLFGFSQGFDEYFFPARGDYGTSYGARLLQCAAPRKYPRLFPSTEAITDVALEWIEANCERPFFLWIHLLDPHWPYEPPSEYVRGERTQRIDLAWGDHDTVTNVQAGNTKLGPADRDRVRELYKGEIRYADANVARVTERLKQLGLYDDALIAFASDHGEEFWEHGGYEHGHTMYDEVLRVPLAFKLPGQAGARTIDAPVSTAALTPTVLDLAGIFIAPERFEHSSLTPWWVAGAEPASAPVFASATYYHGEKRAVVFDGKKLVLDVETGRVEIFDLTTDPRELRSLASSRPDLVERGLELLAEEIEACADQRTRLGITADTTAMSDVDRARLQALGYGGNDG